MIIIHGRRSYGRVDHIQHQHVLTTFWHVWFLPIVPLSSMWVVQDDGSHRRGFAIGLSGRSILAAYLRVWGTVGGLVTAVVGIATGHPAQALAGLAITVVAQTGWYWWRLRGGRAARAQLGMAAIGIGCDPLRIDREAAGGLRELAERRWTEVADGKTPGDLIRDGGATHDQIAAAYTLLRFIARTERGAIARTARADAERLLAAPSTRQLTGAPYRDQVSSSSR